MNGLLKKLINKYFCDTDIPVAYTCLFNEIDELLNAAASSQAAINKEIYQTLRETLHLLDVDQAPAYDENTAEPVLEAARLLKGACTAGVIREQKLLREDKHLKTIQTVAKAGSWEVSLVNNTFHLPTYWSDELFTLLGMERGSLNLTYNEFLTLVHPDDKQYLLEETTKAVHQTGRYDIEYRIHRVGNKEDMRTVREIGEVIMDDTTGKPSKLIGVTVDITDIRNAELALGKANIELRTLFNTMQEVFFSVNMEQGKVLQMSPACLRLYGYEAEEFLQDSHLWFTLIPEEDQELITENNLRLSRGETSHIEHRIRHKNGQLRWVEARITPTMNAEGKLIRIDGFTSDITQRKETELALANSELKFRSLLENSNDIIAVTNENMEFSFVTDSVSRMVGYSTEEIIGTSILQYLHPDDYSFIENWIPVLKAKPESPLPFEMRFRIKDGSWIWIEGLVANHLNGAVVKGYIANFRDVTEKIRYRKALEASNDRLKKINNELDRFVYSVSHDLRAPLASVLGLIEYTASESSEEDVILNLEMMKNSIEKLDMFILDILDYSRNARLKVRTQQINFAELLTDIKHNLKFIRTGKSEVQMNINIEENGTFSSDRSRISIILNNLVSNAMRYYNPAQRPPFVEVNVISGSDGALIVVKDNGIGIEEEYHQKIFDMFFRVSEKSNGSGLGLYLVKETVEKLNGDLQFTSTPGIGTEFRIFLPNLLN